MQRIFIVSSLFTLYISKHSFKVIDLALNLRGSVSFCHNGRAASSNSANAVMKSCVVASTVLSTHCSRSVQIVLTWLWKNWMPIVCQPWEGWWTTVMVHHLILNYQYKYNDKTVHKYSYINCFIYSLLLCTNLVISI